MKKLTSEDGVRVDKEFKKMNEIFRYEEGAGVQISTALANLFAAGCLLHMLGWKQQGKKLVENAMKTAMIDNNDRALYDKIIDNLDGNEKAVMNKIRAHSEMMECFY